MKLQERQYLFDNVTRGLGVVEQVERVRPRRVVYYGHWQVDGQCGPNESVERVVEPRHFVSTCSRNEQREIAREISGEFTARRGDETESFRRIGDACEPVEVERVCICENRARKTVATVFHQN
jgi:hypothetical protein